MDKPGRPATRIVTATHAECTKCCAAKGDSVMHPLENFRKNKQKPYGIEYSCKACMYPEATPRVIAPLEAQGISLDGILRVMDDVVAGRVGPYTGPNTLRCSTCQLPKPKESFAHDESRTRRYAYNCKACNSDKHIERTTKTTEGK